MVWVPGEAQIIRDTVVRGGGVIEHPGQACFNTYCPPVIVPGDKTKAEPWLKHAVLCFPNDYEHIIGFLAHAVQRPFEKVNHALVLISREQGIGKDTLLAPAREAVGPENFVEVSPKQFMGRFNGFAKSVILRVAEAKDLGETNRFDFYDHSKVFAASPPEVHRCDEKPKSEQAVLNRCHMIITSNHMTGGLFLPPEDRRHYVAESPCRPADFPPGYWKELWAWFYDGGFEHVAAYLHAYDLSRFEYVKAPPPKTNAFWQLGGRGGSPESAMVDDFLDSIGRPDALSIRTIKEKATGELAIWLANGPQENRLRHFLDECGYRYFPNPAAKNTYWKFGGVRHAVYTRAGLTPTEQLAAKDALKLERLGHGGIRGMTPMYLSNSSI
jgi:hypothetical protein